MYDAYAILINEQDKVTKIKKYVFFNEFFRQFFFNSCTQCTIYFT